jgi:hypothetical protein
MTRLVDDAYGRFRARMPSPGDAERQDPVYQWKSESMKRLLSMVDIAMEDEGVPDDVRRRVVRTVLFGSPDETDAALRIEMTEQPKQDLMRLPPVRSPGSCP